MMSTINNQSSSLTFQDMLYNSACDWAPTKYWKFCYIDFCCIVVLRLVSCIQFCSFFRCSEVVQNTLKSTARNNIQKDGILATRLCTHKEDVDQLNTHHLHKLTGRTLTPNTFSFLPHFVQYSPSAETHR